MTESEIKGYFPADPVEFESIAPGDRKITKMNRLGQFFMWVFVITCLCFPVHPIVGSSMNPTYVNGQEAVCTRLYPVVSRGDVVIAYANDELLIKRVAALPGDTITINTDGTVYVNGEDFGCGMGNSYVSGYYEGLTENEDGSYSAVMGSNQYYLLGDNRENSADSRVFGVFSRASIRQKVVFVL